MISVIIPVYNEEESLEELHERLSGVIKDGEFIFVDDGSTDRTPEILKKLKEKDPRVKVFTFTRNFGQTQALMCGFEHAKGDIIVALDADLQNPPEEIPKLVEKLNEGYDVVSGWRKNRKDGFLRTLASEIANRIISKISGIPLHDFGCTLKAYRKEIVKSLKLYGEMHRFTPVVAGWMGARIAEVEVGHEKRKYGVSKYGLSRIWKVLLDLFVLAYFNSPRRTPIHIFGTWGILSIVGSLISGIATLWMKIGKGIDMTGNPLLDLTILLAVLGVQFIGTGLLGELMVRTYYESTGKKTYRLKE